MAAQRRRRGWGHRPLAPLGAWAAAVGLALAVAGCAPARSDASLAAATPAASSGTALAALATLPVKGRAAMTGYSRDAFGQAWADTDHNGCDTRDDVLVRDLTRVAFKPGTRSCVVAAGSLADPYTGRTIAFVRGERTSTAVQIDHVVALGDAWQTGASRWSATEREALANDRLELLAVDGPANEAKGDGDAATWLPANTGYRCAYVARQVAVKVAYGLWMTAAEKAASTRVLDTCPGQPLPARSTPAGAAPGSAAPPAAAASAAPTATRSAPAATSAPGGAGSFLRPPSGGYYRAGERCPGADAGRTTRDSSGATLTCRDVDGLRWEH